MVKYVEEFSTNLESFHFGDGNSFAYSEIGVIDARSMEKSVVGCTEGSTIWAPNARDVSTTGRGECAGVKICVQAGSIARVVDMDRTHEIRHIDSLSAAKRGVSRALTYRDRKSG